MITMLVTALAVRPVCAEGSQVFDAYLTLIEIDSTEPFDASGKNGYTVKSKARVHNVIAKVIKVFDGPSDLLNKKFPLTPPPYLEGSPDELTHDQLSFEGVADANKLSVGSTAVQVLYYRKDFNPRDRNFNPFSFPDRSVFYILYGNGIVLDTVWLELFELRLDWAKAINQFNGIEEDEDRVAFLKQSIQNENPLLSVSAVHLLKRYFPQLAEEYFDEIILASGTPFHARLAIDHEFCLSRGQAWVSDKQKELEPILEREASEASMGTRLLSFRKQMIDNGSWFGGRGERE
jgi:hypothetical protein